MQIVYYRGLIKKKTSLMNLKKDVYMLVLKMEKVQQRWCVVGLNSV